MRLRGAGDATPEAWAAAFDGWVAERVQARDAAGLLRWRSEGPHAALAAPTSEHLDPLLVAVGATHPEDVPSTVHEGFTYGNLSMRTIAFEAPGGPPARA